MTTKEELVLAEKSVLGAVMQSDCMGDVLEVVSAGDFDSPLAEHVFSVMTQMHAEGQPLDALTVGDRMRNDGVLARHGGLGTLFDLVQSVPTVSNVDYYARIVAREAAKRRARAALIRGMQLLDGDMDSGEVLEIVQSEVASAARPSAALAWVGDSVDEWRAGLEEEVSCIPTPWPALNALIGGWRPGKTYLIAARPGVGKSIALVQSAIEIARRGAFALSSLEMGTDEIQDRIVAQLADVSLDAIQSHRLTDGERLRIDAAVQEAKGLRLAIDDRADVSIFDVAAHARAVARREPLAAIGMDYVQLAEGTGKATQRENVSETSRQMKLLAKSLHVPFIALSQLNRQPVGRTGRTPESADLKDSGALEQDADVVILVWPRRLKDPETGEEYDSPTEMVVRVDKARSGRQGNFGLVKEGEYARLRNPALSSQTPPPMAYRDIG